MTDIANQLGISKTTVSFILNGIAKEKGISDKMVKKVEKLVAELGYEPNHFARSLRTGKTNIIGLMIENISDSYFAEVAMYIETFAFENNYRVVYGSTKNNDDQARGLLRMFWNLGVDGCIVTPTTGLEADIREYTDKGMKIILFDSYFSSSPADYIISNNELGAYIGTKHMINQGCKSILYVNIKLNQTKIFDREKGYRNAMTESGLNPAVQSFEFKHSNNYTNELVSFFKDGNEMDGVLFATDYLGISGLEAFALLKMSIPGDMAVAVLEDNTIFRIYSPSITAIVQPVEELAETATQTLFQFIKTPVSLKSNKGIILNPALIVRESSLFRIPESS